MAFVYVDRARMTIATTGTGALALGSAVEGFQSFTTAGVANGDTFRYVIEDGPAWETGTGTLSGTSVARSLLSSSTGSLLDLSGEAEVFIGLLAGDVSTTIDLATRAALKALDTGVHTTAILNEPGREGILVWKAGDFSALVASDTQEGAYVKATAIAATSGAWTRVYAGDIQAGWFGALPGGSDATVGLNALLTFLKTYGGVGRLAKGTYATTGNVSAVDAPAAFSLIGEGPQQTVVKRTTDGAYKVLTFQRSPGLRVEGILFDADGTNLTNNSHCVDIMDCANTTVFDCGFINAPGKTCLLSGSLTIAVMVRNLNIINCFAENGANGLFQSYTSHSGFRNCVARSITGDPGYGVQFKNSCVYGYISDCYATDCGHGFAFGQEDAVGAQQCTVVNARTENCSIGFIMGYAAQCTLSNCVFFNCATAGIQISEGSNRNSFSNIIVDGNGTSKAINFAASSTVVSNIVRFAYARDIANIATLGPAPISTPLSSTAK